MVRPARRLRNLLAVVAAWPAVAAASPREAAQWRAEAARVTIVRDEWGIAHVRGRTDADAVFGAIYAQAEDDFGRIERNYLMALGRTAEADGEGAIWADLRQRLFADPADLQARFRASPAWLKRLMTAWADGLNFFLLTHPAVRPAVLTRFEPWMALSFTEGSIGGDVERIDLPALRRFYGGGSSSDGPALALAAPPGPDEPRGSNGIAIAPKNTADGHALLLINPHTSFYFRAELQMTSDAGLNAYGAATWGQFFLYQGFNPHLGWMHTSSGVDSVDEFAERVEPRGRGLVYRYGRAWRPVRRVPVTLRFRRPDGSLASRTFTTLRTHHGPLVAERNGRPIAEALMWKPVPALKQSWLRTKATDLSAYLKVAGLQANSSNDTLYADDTGHIAYLHPQFVPRRNDRFDYAHAVDGSDPATDWRGLHPLSTLPSVIDPPVGWAHNTNDWPWDAAGPDSPKRSAFPRYMDTAGPNPRGLHADELLTGRHDFTPARLMQAAYDSHLPAFDTLVPQLAADWRALPADDPRRASLADPVALLSGWDRRWGAASTATTLACFWGDELAPAARDFAGGERVALARYIAERATPSDRLAALARAVDRLRRAWGDWRVPWGSVNRFQRLDDAAVARFDDAAPSTAVPFVSAQWGSLASFGAKSAPGTRRWYGTSGNSFVAVVEFGPRVRAWGVMAGGESGDPASPHFADQVERYAAGRLRPIHFWPDELAAHVARRYRPGDAGR
jgi:acyl-homoserine-lactone acylase